MVSCWRRVAAVAVSAAALIAVMTGTSMAGTPGAVSLQDQTPPPYAPTGWSTLHAGPENRKYVDTLTAQSYVHRWSVLPGVAMSQAPTIGPEGHVY